MRVPNRQQLNALLSQVIDRAVQGQEPLAHAWVDHARRTNPALTDGRLIDRLERQYLAAVTTTGLAAGAAAAAPGIGLSAIPINVAEIGTFVEATTLYVLALAVIHDIPTHDLERRRTLVLAILIGNAGSGIITKIAGRTGPHWARFVVNAVPLSSIHAINKVLGRNFVTKYGTKQGILVLGRELPLGIGAIIGGAGNAGLGYMSIRAARQAFGPPIAQQASGAAPVPTAA